MEGNSIVNDIELLYINLKKVQHVLVISEKKLSRIRLELSKNTEIRKTIQDIEWLIETKVRELNEEKKYIEEA